MRRKPKAGRRPCAAVAAIVGLALAAMPAGGQTVEDLQQELRNMKQQLKQLQDQMDKQQELIERLSKHPPPTPSAAAAAAPPAVTPPAVAAGAAPPAEEKVEEDVIDKIMRRIQPSLAAANKTFPSQFNPAIGFVIDTVAQYDTNGKANFELRSAELGISANIDPFARGYAIINGTDDGIEVEEAALVTTSLPYNLTLKGGRFFADFGRLSKFHDHDLPFVNRPIVLDEYVGGESQANGVELSYLVPIDQYLTFTAGMYNKMGAENPRTDNLEPRNLSQFTYLGRPATYFNINDSNSVDLGATIAFTPKVKSFTVDDVEELTNGKPRDLVGVDVTYRYIPLSQASYQGLIWGTEALYNHETFNVGTDEDPLFRPKDAWGMYTYLEARLTRRFYPGFLFQFVQPIARDMNNTFAYSPYLTIWASEFQRIRLEYQYLDAPGAHESQFFLQWTGVLGSHVHGFRDR